MILKMKMLGKTHTTGKGLAGVLHGWPGCSRMPDVGLRGSGSALGYRKRGGVIHHAISSQGVHDVETMEKFNSLEDIVEEFSALETPKEKSSLLLKLAGQLPSFPEHLMVLENRVMGCTAQVWISAHLDESGRVHFSGTSDSQLSKGLCSILVQSLSGLAPTAVLEFDPNQLTGLGLGPSVLVNSRANGFLNMVETMKKRTRLLIKDYPTFPSLVISADRLTPIGDFARAQSEFLEPDREAAKALAEQLRTKKVGVVAHFYMDPEVQGMLSAAREFWPHIHVSDSLLMADLSVKMVEEGCKYIAVLGVDFMSENVQAILARAGHPDVQVYRMSDQSIGCSLAEAAESEAYLNYLSESKSQEGLHLHVIYINTSLKTKALSNIIVPTITCTSSNVVQTILQAFAQVPGLNVWYGPDTYMGQNIVQLFKSLAESNDEEIQELHPEHTQASIRSLLGRMQYFQDGSCIVHHLFGGEVCQLVRDAYGDAYLAAHFEVPGEMFDLAMEAKKRGMGVVGSTSQILGFISDVVEDELRNPRSRRLQFVLGTETGMITSIVRKIQGMLKSQSTCDLEVEIVFPVSPQSISTSQQETNGVVQPLRLPGGLAVIPGPAAGEGCSLEGGCANCPYMKMNSLNALTNVLNCIGTPVGEASISAFQPKEYEMEGNISIADAGCTPIVHMRGFQLSGQLPPELIEDIQRKIQ